MSGNSLLSFGVFGPRARVTEIILFLFFYVRRLGVLLVLYFVCTGMTNRLPSAELPVAGRPLIRLVGVVIAHRRGWLQCMVLENVGSFVHVVRPAKALASVATLIYTTYRQMPWRCVFCVKCKVANKGIPGTSYAVSQEQQYSGLWSEDVLLIPTSSARACAK